MSNFFRPNLRRAGRTARGVVGSLCLIVGIVLVDDSLPLGLVFVVTGLLGIVQGLCGWSLVRAFGIRIKLGS